MNILLADVRPEKHFVANDGTVIKNIYSLVDSLKKINNNTFEHHVNNDRNDFANWIRHVLKDKELADNIQRLKNKTKIIRKIERRIKYVEDKEHSKYHGVAKKEHKPIKQMVGLKKLAKTMQQVLHKEKSIEAREKKIQEIESKIEKKIVQKETSFFSLEFLIGVTIGFILGFIILMISIKLIF
ncbi:hypothetical protein HQ529_01185 [Candidatus Woesearchaeota archaeon]|nr:hypothetical protein [Candidatus Woesearchaeota archaeon]